MVVAYGELSVLSVGESRSSIVSVPVRCSGTLNPTTNAAIDALGFFLLAEAALNSICACQPNAHHVIASRFRAVVPRLVIGAETGRRLA